ncbi:MAG: hypothetical protein ACK506_16270 [Pirellula sp.]
MYDGIWDGIGMDPIGNGWLMLIPLALFILFWFAPNRDDDGTDNKLW